MSIPYALHLLSMLSINCLKFLKKYSDRNKNRSLALLNSFDYISNKNCAFRTTSNWKKYDIFSVVPQKLEY